VNTHTQQDNRADRFAFGANWQRFLSVLDEERIAEAEHSLRQSLEVSSLMGLSFLDIGSGSGLFSLAAMRLGASRVHSFDLDPLSVACTAELRRRYFAEADNWTVEAGSALDAAYVESLGEWDVVYSWGVLHHTGNMEEALRTASSAVAPGGRLFISIYNDQGRLSRVWRRVKHAYNVLPQPFRKPYAVAVIMPFELACAGKALVTLQPQRYVKSWTHYKRSRGMSRWYDLIDWVGGYPFEVARPEWVFEFFKRRGFVLTKLRTCGGGLGCNEYVFTRPQ
jgi:2-polyprenyl-6-hydroxyphenyl methylase/3-demethylubiquinone-9 3-methyltransferase